MTTSITLCDRCSRKHDNCWVDEWDVANADLGYEFFTCACCVETLKIREETSV
jgi:hypothetical protein